MNSCEACQHAETNPVTGRYQAGCTECAALTNVFGEGNEDAGHARVKAQAKRITNHTEGTA